MDDTYIPGWSIDRNDGTSMWRNKTLKVWGDAEEAIREAVRIAASWDLGSTPWVDVFDDFITVTTITVHDDYFSGEVEVGIMLTPDGAGWLLEY